VLDPYHKYFNIKVILFKLLRFLIKGFYFLFFFIFFNVSFILLIVDFIFQVGEANLTKWGHQAVEFILGTGCDSAMHFI
jgi:hypothetical protein